MQHHRASVIGKWLVQLNCWATVYPMFIQTMAGFYFDQIRKTIIYISPLFQSYMKQPEGLMMFIRGFQIHPKYLHSWHPIPNTHSKKNKKG